MMKELTAHIEANSDGLFSIYVEEDMPFGIIGEGYTVEKAKLDFIAVYNAMRLRRLKTTGLDEEYVFNFVLDKSAVFAINNQGISKTQLRKLKYWRTKSS